MNGYIGQVCGDDTSNSRNYANNLGVFASIVGSLNQALITLNNKIKAFN